MGVYQSENGCYYSTPQECDQPQCLADGGHGEFFGVFSQTTVNRHQHTCCRLPDHKGKHLCGNQYCNHQWENK
jgi:hypothetical protein